MKVEQRNRALGDIPEGSGPGARDGVAGEGRAPAYDAGPLPLLTRVLEGMAGLDRMLRSGVDDDSLTEIVEGLGHVDALSFAVRIRAITAAEDADLPGREGAASTADWLAGATRSTRADAARQVRDARLLADDPATMAALATGQLSRGHATELAASLRRQAADQEAAEAARIAEEERQRREREEADAKAQQQARDEAERQHLADEAAEREKALAEKEAAERAAREAADREERQARNDQLRDEAKNGANPDEVRQHAKDQRATDPAALERDATAKWHRRHLRRWRDRTTGLACYAIGVPDDVDELFQSLLEATRTHDHPSTPLAERRTTEQRSADAFVDLLHAAAHHGELPTRHGVKPHVTVTAPAATLTGGDQAGRGTFGAQMSPETVRKLACDAGLTRALVNSASQVLELGRETPRWTSAQYKAIALMYGGCAFPVADGTPCGRPIGWTDIHHVTWYRHGGRTDRRNGVPLCRHHHNAVHHDGWVLSLDYERLAVTVERSREGRTVRRTACFAPPPADQSDGRLPL